MDMLQKILEAFGDDKIKKADSLDQAVIGIDTNTNRLIYSEKKI